MTYWRWSAQDDRTENERYLEDQLEQERQHRREMEEQRERERQARRDEMRERLEEDRRQAETWPEALRKQAYLFGREVSLEIAHAKEYGYLDELEEDDYFGPGAAACERALELWPEAEAAVADEITAVEAKIAELEAEIAELRAGIAHRVADRLDEENADGNSGWWHVAQALRDTEEEPGALGNWLYW